MVERQHVEQELADLWFGALASASTIGAFRAEFGRGIVWVNDACAEICGTPRADVIGKSWRHGVHPDDLPRVVDVLAVAQDDPRPLEVEFRLTRPDGNVRWVRVRAAPVGSGDEGIGYAGTLEDLTDAVETAGEAARLAAACQTTTDVVVITDASGRVRYLNPAGRALLGVDAEEGSAALMTTDLYTPASLARVQTEMLLGLVRDGRWHGEVELAGRDGTAIPVSLVATLERGVGDAVEHIVVVARDVRPERALVAEASRSEARFRMLAEASPFGIVEITPRGQIAYVNQRFCELVGLTVDEAREQLATGEVIHSDDREDVISRIVEAIGDERAETVEHRLVRGDGTVLWALARTTPVFTDDGHFHGYVATVEDVSEEVRERAGVDRLVGIFDATPDCASIVDADGRILFMNPAARELFGIGLDEDLTDRDWRSFYAPWAIGRLEGEAAAALAERGVWVGEAAIVASDGRDVPVSQTTVVSRGDDGTEWYATIARDISELKEAEARLAESEAWFRTLLQNLTDLVVVQSADGRIHYVSPSVETMLGYSPAQFLSGQLVDMSLVHPDDHEVVRAAWREARDEPGGTARSEYRVRHHDGDWRWLQTTMHNLLDDLSVRGIVANSTDVTEERRAREAQARSEDALRAIVLQSPLAIYAVDRDGTVRLWNHAAEEMFGYHADEVVGRKLPMNGEKGTSRFGEIRGRVMRGETIRGAELESTRKDGTAIVVSLSAAPVRDEHGEIATVLGVFNDITAEKEQERSLRESEARLRALAEHASVIITILEADGTVRYGSPSASRILGYPEGYGEGKNVFSYVHPEDRERVAELFDELTRELGATETVMLRVQNAAGEWRTIEAVGNNLLDDPAVCGILITARDVTEQLVAEQAARSSEERFRALVQNLTDIVTIVDGDGSIRWMSPAVERVLGYTVDEILAKGAIELVHPDDRERLVQMIDDQLGLPGPQEPVAIRVRHADGSWRHIESVLADLRENPAVAGLVITSRDATGSLEAEARLAESEARYRGIVEDQTELICRYDRHGTLTFINEAFARYFDKRVDELVGTRHSPFIPDEDHERLRRALSTLGPGNPAVTIEFRILRPDGAIRWHEWTHRAVFDAEGEVVEYGALGRDITEQHEAEALVVDQARVLEMAARGAPLSETLEELCRIVESHAPDVVCSVLLVDDANPGYLRFGAAPSVPDTMVGHLDGVPIGLRAGSCGTAAHLGEPVVVTDVETDPLWSDYRQVPLSHGLHAAWSYPITAAPNDRVVGTFCLYSHEAGSPSLRHEHLVEMVVHHAAIAIERKHFESQLAHQAHHDPLTELPNRVLFLEFLVLALARARRYRSTVAVLFLDLDRFKVINDSLGHDTGDEVLVALGERLRSVLRPGDTVARFGGDEFTVLCEDLSGPQAKRQAVEVAERLLDVIHQPFVLDGEEHFLSASIGIALATSGDDRPDALLRDADAAMYRAKERGKGRWELFDDSMRLTAIRRLEIENSLHRAIDRGEFRVFYQPCMSIPDGRCVGAEALVRWQHPERGLVAPMEFIGLAEETGIVVPLGQWVLEEACRQVSRWHAERAEGGFFQVAVNLSGRQLSHPELVEQVAAVIGRTGVDPALVCLEITESVLMEDVDATIGTLGRLKELGVGLSIDDFGTGYSSLSSLKRFPVDLVKVDQSFVSGLGTDAEDSAIVAAVVSLGHALGLQVVAEGVESELQLAELERLGCDQAQGYLFAPPQPALGLHGLMTGSTSRWSALPGSGS